MRYLFGFICVLALGVMGCSETAGTGGNGGTAGSGGMAGDGGDGGTAPLTVLVIDTTEEGIAALEGVEVCQMDTTNCVLTDEGGNATLEVPADQETGFTLDKKGYGGQLRADVIPANGSYVPTPLPTDAERGAQFEALMSPYPMEGTGTIHVQAGEDPAGNLLIAGATFQLLGTKGESFYVDDDGNWSSDLSSTTSQGGGGFVELSPGEYEIEVGGAAENCAVVRGWATDSENTIRVPVREGFVTIARVDCD